MGRSPAANSFLRCVRKRGSVEMTRTASAAWGAVLYSTAFQQTAWVSSFSVTKKPFTTRANIPTETWQRNRFLPEHSCSEYQASNFVTSQTRRWSSSSVDDDDDSSPHSSALSDEQVKQQTLDWVRRVVIGLNFCPFAERPLRENKLKIHVVRGSDDLEILSQVLYEAIVRQEKPGTTLVVAPECYPDDFESYLAVVETLEQDFMGPNDLTGDVQVAPFHPLFEFDGSGKDGIDNWTNRSPFPMFHLLREDEVENAVEKLGGDAGKIWKRNVELLSDLVDTLGRDGVESMMEGKAVSAPAGDLKEILKRHKLKLSDAKPDDDTTEK